MLEAILSVERQLRHIRDIRSGACLCANDDLRMINPSSAGFLLQFKPESTDRHLRESLNRFARSIAGPSRQPVRCLSEGVEDQAPWTSCPFVSAVSRVSAVRRPLGGLLNRDGREGPQERDRPFEDT